jgi:hypothetical protein
MVRPWLVGRFKPATGRRCSDMRHGPPEAPWIQYTAPSPWHAGQARRASPVVDRDFPGIYGAYARRSVPSPPDRQSEEDVALTVSPIYDDPGTVIAASKIARDIRERTQHGQPFPGMPLARSFRLGDQRCARVWRTDGWTES